MVNIVSLPDRPAGKARLPGGAAWFPKVNNALIRVPGARNGDDGYGRKWFNGTILQRVVCTCLSGFEMGNPGIL